VIEKINKTESKALLTTAKCDKKTAAKGTKHPRQKSDSGKSRWSKILLASIVAIALLGLVKGSAIAADAPVDAGQVLRQTQPSEPRPFDRVFDLKTTPPSKLDESSGGATVQLTQIMIEGNSAFSGEELRLVLGDVAARDFDFGGLRALANKLSDYYRLKGYPFARAFLPAQPLSSGELRIAVVEGRYGKVFTSGKIGALLQPYLAELQTGDVIESSLLAHNVLILQDLPGLVVRPVIRQGADPGTGDLDVQVVEAENLNGYVSLGNKGNRYTGAYRGLGSMGFNGLWRLGDELLASVMLSDQNLRFGSLAYSTPVGYQGGRLGASYIRTQYDIAEFDSSLIGINAYGIAEVASITTSYPLVRGQHKNLKLTAELSHRKFQDTGASVQTTKEATVIPIWLNFDWQDNLLGTAYSYGKLQVTFGRLALGSTALLASDAITARTNGGYTKMFFDISRTQYLSARISAHGRVQGQWGNKNLDSSEDMPLGGPDSVRAYPNGEAFSDEAIVGQFELRFNAPGATPFVFYDLAQGTRNADPWASGANKRKLTGGGVGVRFLYPRWTAETSLAWRIEGGAPQAYTQDDRARFLVGLTYRY